MNMNTSKKIWDRELNDKELLENKNILERWFERNTTLSIYEISILFHIIDKAKGRLDFFYKVDDVLESKIDEYMNEELGAMVTKTYSKYKIETSIGTLKLSYEHLKSVVARIIDIYSIYLPLGTVVEVAAQDVKDVFPVEGEDDVKLIIVGRMVKFSDKLMNTYTGVVYPLSNIGRYTFTLNFTNKNIKKIVDLGYEDEMDKEYLLFTKKEMIVDKNLYSMGMIDKFEREELSKCMS